MIPGQPGPITQVCEIIVSFILPITYRYWEVVKFYFNYIIQRVTLYWTRKGSVSIDKLANKRHANTAASSISSNFKFKKQNIWIASIYRNQSFDRYINNTIKCITGYCRNGCKVEDDRRNKTLTVRWMEAAIFLSKWGHDVFFFLFFLNFIYDT